MDAYRQIETLIAAEYGTTPNSSRKSIGDFFLNGDPKCPVNVKSSNRNDGKNNYSPNMISAKRLIEWLKKEGNELYFIFVDYIIIDSMPKIVKKSDLIKVYNISWNCLTIQAQGWGIIQMNKEREEDNDQDKKGFFQGMKAAYEIYLGKEAKKAEKIREMIKGL
jgi:hypothetical protein